MHVPSLENTSVIIASAQLVSSTQRAIEQARPLSSFYLRSQPMSIQHANAMVCSIQCTALKCTALKEGLFNPWYEGVASVTIPDEAAYKALIKDLNRQQKAKNDKEKKARKQAASIAAAKEQLALACALVAPRSCSAVTAGNAATPASSSAAGPPGVPCTEALQGAMTAPSIETAAAGHGGSKKQAGDGPSRDRAAAAPAALAAGLGGSETLSLGLDLTRKDQAVLLSIDLEW
eukprot:1140355-Pelagomonas_calceolata.AAC.15